jgi:CRP/FNR family transcriptional regulator, cyclic AMP receptor protein
MQSNSIPGATRNASTLELARLFSGVPENVRQFVLGSTQPMAVKKGTSLFERGDKGGTMYVVQQGRIEISIITEIGRKIVLNQVPPGHCVGEIGMIDTGERTASAMALEDSRLFMVARSTFLEAVQTCPQLSINLMEIFCERLRWVSNSVEEYALHSVELRLARRLLVLHKSFGEAAEGISITQNDLADFAGATRESVNKILMQWKQDGAVDVKRGKIILIQLEVLDRIAHGETEV